MLMNELCGNGRRFFIERKPHKSWMLYLWQGDEWEQLSYWSTRSEAVEAAKCFVPKPGDEEMSAHGPHMQMSSMGRR